MKFSIEELRPIRNGMTISRDSRLGNSTKVTYFSMGKDTSISQESYDRMENSLLEKNLRLLNYSQMNCLLYQLVHYVECRHLTELCIQKLYVQERILI